MINEQSPSLRYGDFVNNGPRRSYRLARFCFADWLAWSNRPILKAPFKTEEFPVP